MESTAEQTGKCARPACNCPPQSTGGYCREHCKNAGPTETLCKCGHPDC